MVLHHTFDPDHVVPDSNRFTKRDDMLIVDCLFNEDDGLLRCERNYISQSTMLKWIDAKVIPAVHVISINKSIILIYCNYF